MDALTRISGLIIMFSVLAELVAVAVYVRITMGAGLVFWYLAVLVVLFVYLTVLINAKGERL